MNGGGVVAPNLRRRERGEGELWYTFRAAKKWNFFFAEHALTLATVVRFFFFPPFSTTLLVGGGGNSGEKE